MFTCCEAELKRIFLKVRLETFIFDIDKVTPALAHARKGHKGNCPFLFFSS